MYGFQAHNFMNIKRNKTSDIKWDIFQRLKLIELVSYWEGRLTTNHLCQAFGIKRQQASRDIKAYQLLFPGNITLCRKAKGYIPTITFVPRLTKGYVDEYLNMLNENQTASKFIASVDSIITPIEEISAPPRYIPPEAVRILLEACRKKSRVEVCYASSASPAGEDRIISPHSLVSSGYRWHVRAYCERDKKYKDFVLSRFINLPDFMGDCLNDPGEDKEWHTFIDLELIPNPSFDENYQKIIALERGMTNGKLKITVRAATLHYTLLLLQVPTGDTYNLRQHPVVLKNKDLIKKYLFPS